MAGILTSDLEEAITLDQTPLMVESCLGEFNEGLKATARGNLGVYSTEEVYDKTDTNIEISKAILDAFNKYLDLDDPPITEETARQIVREALEGYVKRIEQDQFLKPSKDYTDSKLKIHLDTHDPHRILPEVEDKLELYVKQSDTYFKDLLYTKNEIDRQSGLYVKKDGTTPFTKAQIGADPQIDSHLATKRYVDKVLYNHLVDVDPHGFILILNSRLSSYAKAKNVWDKSQTYSRDLIDSIIRSLVNDAALEAIQDHLNQFDPHGILSEVRKEKYVKQDGTIPFRSPLKGQDAIDPLDLVTLHQVEEKIGEVNQTINELPDPVWITSGPVEATVGMVNEGDNLAHEVSFQEAMDAIFYGKRVHLTTPELSPIGQQFPITLCILGSLATVEYVEIYLDGNYLGLITREQLQESGCVTLDSLPINGDSEITAKVFYTNGSVHEVSSTTKVSMPVFVGLLRQWKSGFTLTYDYLLELSREDPLNNKFYDKGKNMQELSHQFTFDSDDLLHIIVALPAYYSDLVEMSNASLQYTSDAFDIIDMIPFLIPGATEDVVYKLYIYKLTLYSLNSTINFKFLER